MFMKNRLHDKKAGILILVSLIIISVVEVGIRHVFFRDMISTTSNYAETLAVIGLALTILIFTLKGKDRICYILYGAWIAYFVLDQVFELPGIIVSGINVLADGFDILIFVGWIIRVICMSCIVVLGGLLVEYMNDGSIYNKIFNALCIITILLLIFNILIPLYGSITTGINIGMLDVFNNLYRLAMVFLFSFFTYDSAKKQLSKVDFSK